MPSYSEMAELFNVKSKNAVFKILNKFIKEGILKKDDKGKISFKTNPFGIRVLGFV